MIIISWTIDSIRYKSFESNLNIGTRLTNKFKDMSNEFDDGTIFNITIVRKGNEQVIVKYSDGSESIMTIQQLFDENWTII